MMMKKLAVVSLFGLALAGCDAHSQTDRTLGGAAIGAGSGALIGAAAGGGRGAAIGAIAGGATGAVIGHATTPNSCIYRDAYGREYAARCP